MKVAPLLFIVFPVLVEAAYIPKDIRKKPGQCPYVVDIAKRQCPLPPDVQNIVAFNDFLMSIAECLFDGDCKGTDKCCFDGCKTKCTQIKKPKWTALHKGKCPLIDKSRQNDCQYLDDFKATHTCTRDIDCRKNEKCCFDGCIAKCTQVKKPPVIKPGECPRFSVPDGQKCPDTSDLVGDSTDELLEKFPDCYADGDCKGAAKCCSNGCNLKCVDPALPTLINQTNQDIQTEKSKLKLPTKSTTKNREGSLVEDRAKYNEESRTEDSGINQTVSTAKEQNVKLEIQRTFVMIKPDGVRRGLISDVIGRFERKGYKLIAMKLVKPTEDLLRKHYSYLESMSLIQDMIEYVGSGPVVAMIWQGVNAVGGVKRILGAPGILTAAPGTIRFDFSAQVSRDIVHGSNSLEQAAKEINLWFSRNDVYDWDAL